MFSYFTISLAAYAWLFLAVVDMAARAPSVIDGADSFKQAIGALLWPIKRPLDVLGLLWSKIRG